MKYKSLKEYLNNVTITKKEFILIRDFCKENNMKITFF